MNMRWLESLVISVRINRMNWRSFGHFETHDSLDRNQEGDLVGIAGHPFDPVDQRNDLRVGADFAEFLVAAMHVTDDRLHVVYLLAVDFGDKAQHTVS